MAVAVLLIQLLLCVKRKHSFEFFEGVTKWMSLDKVKEFKRESATEVWMANLEGMLGCAELREYR